MNTIFKTAASQTLRTLAFTQILTYNMVKIIMENVNEIVNIKYGKNEKQIKFIPKYGSIGYPRLFDGGDDPERE